MYRVGFGDCFLLSLPVDGGTEHIMIDCGVHTRGDIHKIADAVADVAKESGGKLALVIVTHAHQDHISGFASCGEQLKQLSVREVWMPWTEDPSDKDARLHKQKQAALTALVNQHLAAAPAANPQALYAIENLAPNQTAMNLLRSGISGGRVSYFAAGDVQDPAAGIPGLKIRVLGPPRDEKFLSRMDPPANDRFLRATAGGVETVGAIAPFADRWTVSDSSFPKNIIKEGEFAELDQLAGDPSGLAFQLDQVMNNTSLVSLISYKGQNLLFPGDAQYGNWDYWIETPEGAEILSSVDFYKVGHHGSHNATPKSALDKMTQGKFAAMISTQAEPFPSIPFEKLISALKARSKGFVRSDSIKVPGAPEGPNDPPPAGFSKGPFWYDYTIALG
jgi:beta-lactamase superfamily II metal-dependent hydrolase